MAQEIDTTEIVKLGFAKRALAVGTAGLFGLAGLAACGQAAETGEADSDETAEAVEAEEADAETGEGDGSSLDSPLPAGSSVEVGDWTVTISEWNADATDDILSENEFNEEPAEDNQFAMFRVEGTYNGDEQGSLWLDLSVEVAAGGILYDTTCGSTPDDLFMTDDVTNGGSVTGNDCRELPSDAAGEAVFAVSDLFSFDGEKVYIAVE